MRPIASDHRSGRGAGWMDAVTRRRVTGDVQLSRWVVSCVVRRSVVRLQLQLRIVGGRRSMGGPADGSLRNNHGGHVWATRISEYRQRQQPAV